MHINEVKYTNYWKTTCPQRALWSLWRSVHCFILNKQTHRGGGDTKFIVRPISCPPGMCTTAISMLIFSLWLCFLSAPALKKTIRLLSFQMLHYLQQLIAKFGAIWCIRNQLWRDSVVGFSIQRVLPTWNRIQNGNPVSPFILPKYEWLEHMSRQIDTAVLTLVKQKKEKKNVVKVMRRLCVPFCIFFTLYACRCRNGS